jgi:hypothetical protein
MAKPHPEQNLLEKVMYGSPCISSETVLFEAAKPATLKGTTRKKSFTLVNMKDHHHPRSSLSLLQLARCTSRVVLDCDRDPTIIIHDESLEMEDALAMEICEAPTPESEGKDSMDKHGRFLL